MIGILGFNIAVVLALVVALLIAIAVALEDPRSRVLLRRFAWFRRFEQLPASELRHLGTLVLGLAICCFAALLTLQLFGSPPRWLATTLAIATVVQVTLAAALMSHADRD